MPMYSFVCKDCGKRFDDLVAYSQRDQVICPDCGGKTQVQVSAFAVKGGGLSGSGAAPASSGFS